MIELTRDEIEQMFREHLGLRLGGRMCDYVRRRIAETAASTSDGFAVMGGDARTGVAQRRIIPLSDFATCASRAPRAARTQNSGIMY